MLCRPGYRHDRSHCVSAVSYIGLASLGLKREQLDHNPIWYQYFEEEILQILSVITHFVAWSEKSLAWMSTCELASIPGGSIAGFLDSGNGNSMSGPMMSRWLTTWKVQDCQGKSKFYKYMLFILTLMSYSHREVDFLRVRNPFFINFISFDFARAWIRTCNL
jgi:hypothetical protein